MKNKDSANLLIRYNTPKGSYVKEFKNEKEIESFIKKLSSKYGKDKVSISVIEKLNNFSLLTTSPNEKLLNLSGEIYIIYYTEDTIEVCRLIDKTNSIELAKESGKEWITTRSSTRKTSNMEIRKFLEESFANLDDFLFKFDKRFVNNSDIDKESKSINPNFSLSL